MALITTDTRRFICNPLPIAREVTLDVEYLPPEGGYRICSNLSAKQATELRDALDAALAKLPQDPEAGLRDTVARLMYGSHYEGLVSSLGRNKVDDVIAAVREAGR